MGPVIRMHAYDYDPSAAHCAQWQELELILRWLLQHENMRERRERASLRPVEAFMRECMRPMEAACFCLQKSTKNRQQIDTGIQRFLRQACSVRFRIL